LPRKAPRAALDRWRKNWSRLPREMKRAVFLMLLASVLMFTALYILSDSLVSGTLRFVLFEGLALGGLAASIYFRRTLSKYTVKSLKKYYAIGILLALVIILVIFWES
jgi:hypothetical protein